MRATKQDEELTVLLTKLYTIQEQVGAKEPTSTSDKRSRAEQAGQQQQQQSTMGRTRKSKKVGSRFLELKSSIVEHLRTVHTLIEAQNNSTKLNPKEVIAAQAEIREVLRQSSDEWAEINELYKNEARKKKSKFTVEELEVQQALVMQLKSEIDKVKEGQLAAHARGGMVEQQNIQVNLNALAALDAVDFSTESGNNDMSKSSWTPGGGGGGTALTMNQQLQLEQIRHRDAEFDTELDEIGEGIQDLRELALRQGEEVRRQNVMLTNTASRIDEAHEHMTNVNAKMKETLKEVGRSSDKLCVDIMCILLAVGFAGIFYKMSKGEF